VVKQEGRAQVAVAVGGQRAGGWCGGCRQREGGKNKREVGERWFVVEQGFVLETKTSVQNKFFVQTISNLLLANQVVYTIFSATEIPGFGSC
jgi:hypothetical protein